MFRRQKSRDWLWGFFFIGPGLVLILLFVLWPAAQTLALSFLNKDGFAGLRNFANLFGDKAIWDPARFLRREPPWGALLHNLVWVCLHLPITVALGLFLAVLFAKAPKWVSIFRSALFLGIVTPMIVGGVVIRYLFEGHSGIIPQILGALGVGKPWSSGWMAYPETALLGLIVGSTWLWTGFSMVLHSAGLSSIDPELFEAAQIDGASEWAQFKYITVPLLRPVTIVVAVLTLFWELKIFDIVYVATMGGPGRASTVLALEMYFAGFRALDPYKASAIATLITAVSVPLGYWFAARRVRR